MCVWGYHLVAVDGLCAFSDPDAVLTDWKEGREEVGITRAEKAQ
jgi:hypothetical protein